MAYYIIDIQTNKINPNLITGKVALYKTEQDYKKANNPNHRPSTDEEILQYSKDLLAYKIANATQNTIVRTHKIYNNIDNTKRVDIEDHLKGQINEDIYNIEYFHIATTGTLLSEFIANEFTGKQKENMENCKKYANDKNNNIVSNANYSTKYLICNVKKVDKKDITKYKYIELPGLDLDKTFDETVIYEASNKDPIIITSVDNKLEINVNIDCIKAVKQQSAEIKQDKDLLLTRISSAIEYNIQEMELSCSSEIKNGYDSILKSKTPQKISDEYSEKIDKIQNTYKQKIDEIEIFYNKNNNLDVDGIKDGKNTILISKYDITIYDLTKSIDVLMGLIAKEDTNITDVILKFELI